jgi:hypothetical protein
MLQKVQLQQKKSTAKKKNFQPLASSTKVLKLEYFCKSLYAAVKPEIPAPTIISYDDILLIHT